MLLQRVDKADKYCRPIVFDKTDFKQLNIQLLAQFEANNASEHRLKLEKARYETQRKVAIPGEIRNDLR